VVSLVPLIKQQARTTARLFPGPRVMEDSISVGNEAAIGIVIRFDPDEGTPLWGYARKRLQWAMIEAVLQQRRSPGKLLARLQRLQSRSEGTDEGADLSISTLLDAPPPRTVAIDGLRRKTAALIAAVFTQPASDSVEDVYLAREAVAAGMAALERAMAALDDQERGLVIAFYKDELTIDGVAARLGLKRITTRRLHDRVRAKLADLLHRLGVDGPVTGEE